MKPLPNLSDESAMLLRGRRSALGSARNEAAESLRDACTLVQSAEIGGALIDAAKRAQAAANRLIEISELWESLK